jgi:hypothetical protein
MMSGGDPVARLGQTGRKKGIRLSARSVPKNAIRLSAR